MRFSCLHACCTSCLSHFLQAGTATVYCPVKSSLQIVKNRITIHFLLYIQAFSLAPCPHSVCTYTRTSTLPLRRETKFYTRIKQQVKSQFCMFQFLHFKIRDCKTKDYKLNDSKSFRELDLFSDFS